MDEDGSGDISKDEFLLYMLENLEAVDPMVINQLRSKFDQLERSGELVKYKLFVEQKRKVGTLWTCEPGLCVRMHTKLQTYHIMLMRCASLSVFSPSLHSRRMR